jgi:[acyl-carrier-protein] S-malonyltransferase
MGLKLFEASEQARRRFHEAREVLGFDLPEIMFHGTDDDLRRTSVTQPAIYVHSVVLAEVMNICAEASMAAGHSLGEFSALAAVGALDFAEGLRLVSIRANAMQKACDLAPSTMAAIVGLDDAVVEQLCAEVPNVVAANYNSPGQLVISGSIEGVEQAIALARSRGAKIAKQLAVNGAFHSPFMEPARAELATALSGARIVAPAVPIYQNVDGLPHTDPEQIRENLVRQLTAAVRWTQTVRAMAAAGATRVIELGQGKVLSGLTKRIEAGLEVESRDSL